MYRALHLQVSLSQTLIHPPTLVSRILRLHLNMEEFLGRLILLLPVVDGRLLTKLILTPIQILFRTHMTNSMTRMSCVLVTLQPQSLPPQQVLCQS